MKITKCKKPSPKGLAIWPKLQEPDQKFGKYQVTIKLSSDEAKPMLEEINSFLDKWEEETRAELTDKVKNGKDGKAKAAAKKCLEDLVIHRPYTNSVDDEGEELDDIEFKFSSNASYKNKSGELVNTFIKLFDSKGTEIKKCPPIWSGSVLRIDYSLSPYYMPATNMCGVTLKINGAQVIELSSGGSSCNFSDEGEGYTNSSSTNDNSGFDDESNEEENSSDDF